MKKPIRKKPGMQKKVKLGVQKKVKLQPDHFPTFNSSAQGIYDYKPFTKNQPVGVYRKVKQQRVERERHERLFLKTPKLFKKTMAIHQAAKNIPLPQILQQTSMSLEDELRVINPNLFKDNVQPIGFEINKI
jgi:hypothetical protein